MAKITADAALWITFDEMRRGVQGPLRSMAKTARHPKLPRSAKQTLLFDGQGKHDGAVPVVPTR